jgi:glycerol-3-phosphate acyltransferase PlsX
VNHGSSNDRAIYNGIRVTAEFALAGVNQQLEQEFACRKPADPPSEPDMTEPIQPLY